MEGECKIFERIGSFGEYTVSGTLWKFADEGAVWGMVVTSSTTGQPDATRVNLACRVSVDTDDIHCVKADTSFPEFEVKTDSVATNIAPSIKEAILAAKRAWMEDHVFISIDEAAKLHNVTMHRIEELIRDKGVWCITWGKRRMVSRYDLDRLSPDELGGLRLV